MRIIDISKYNGAINWTKAAKEIDGAIIRAGYRGYGSGTLVTDTRYLKNIKEAAGKTKIGVYFVTQAINEAEARKEAKYTLNLIKGYHLELPVFIDTEDGNGGRGRADHNKLTKAKRTSVIKAFCEEIEKAGYEAGIYASEYWFKTYLDYNKLKSYFVWIAKYSKNAPSLKCDAWQYTDTGKVNGISGRVDISEFNLEATRPIEEIAEEVLNGLWGNGEERKKRLEEAGFDYKAVQKLVNRIIKERSTK